MLVQKEKKKASEIIVLFYNEQDLPKFSSDNKKLPVQSH